MGARDIGDIGTGGARGETGVSDLERFRAEEIVLQCPLVAVAMDFDGTFKPIDQIADTPIVVESKHGDL